MSICIDRKEDEDKINATHNLLPQGIHCQAAARFVL
jgi:hypothetical protein